MQAVHGDLGGGDPIGQLEAEHDLGELALLVGPDAAVVVLEHEVVEVERLLTDRCDVDDPCRCGAPEQRQQLEGEQEGGQVVDGEPQFVAVGADPAGATLGFAGADSGVVDQDVEPVRRRPHVARPVGAPGPGRPDRR